MTDLDKGLRQRLAEGQHAEAAQIGRGDGLPDREAEQALRDGTPVSPARCVSGSPWRCTTRRTC